MHDPATGKFLTRLGGTNSTRLLGPKGLTVSGTGELVVVDNKASCLYVLQVNTHG